jgi:DNA-binding HxlR family transcriptional regulator
MEPTNGGAGTAREVYREPWVAPGYEVLQAVVDKWAPLVICALRKGPKRHGELRRAIGGISQKMLTQTVRKLEQFGLVARHVQDTIPPAVEYALTPLGESLSIPLEGVFKWGETHLREMAPGGGAGYQADRRISRS